MSKGDWTRPYDKKKYDENFRRIFGERPLKTWNPEEDDGDGENLAEGCGQAGPSDRERTAGDDTSGGGE